MHSIKQILDDPSFVKTPEGKVRKYVSREWQDYGYRLARELGDEAHKSLYMKLAKEVDRAMLERVKRFVMDSNADKKGALFMWKLGQLKKGEDYG